MRDDLGEQLVEAVVHQLRLERLAELACGTEQQLRDLGLALELACVHRLTVAQRGAVVSPTRLAAAE